MMRHFCSLPEEILLLIMELLDATSIQCLRRTSRVFLQLFSFPCFHGQHNHDLADMPRCNKPAFIPWARPSRAFEIEAHTQQFFDVLERDARRNLCSDCRSAATGLRGLQRARSLVDKLLYCTGCKTDHPLVYFSAAQRQPWCDTTRICIGREGYVRLCKHLVIGWDAIAEAARDLQNQALGITDDIVSMPLLQCQATSHLPTHHEGTDKGHPFLELRRTRGKTVLHFSWTGHLALSKETLNGQYSAWNMTDNLSRLRIGAAEYIAPQLGPGCYLQEMRLFDPNRCGILDYTGTPAGNGIPGDWSFASRSTDTTYQSCRLHSECSLHGKCRQVKGYIVGSHVIRIFLGQQPGMRGSEYGCVMYLRRCAASDRCLRLWYKRTITVQPRRAADCSKVTHAWFEAVDPDSYALREDDETYGTLWCRDEACANYYLYTERPVLRRCRRKLGETADWFRTYAGHTANQFYYRETRSVVTRGQPKKTTSLESITGKPNEGNGTTDQPSLERGLASKSRNATAKLSKGKKNKRAALVST